jgi:hypothetical protein
VILSASDIYGLLNRDPILGALATVRIVESRPALDGGDGVYIYIKKYPSVEDFEATWNIWIIDHDENPLDVVIAQIRKLLPRFEIIEQNQIIRATTTELRTDRTELEPVEVAPELRPATIEDIDSRFDELSQSIEDRMLLVGPGRPGKDGRDGVDGRDGDDGLDGKDLDATEAELGDLSDVFVSDAKKRQFLMFDGSSWIPSFVPQIMKVGAGASVDANLLRQICGIDQTGEPMGHADRLDSTVSFNATTRVFTISPVDSSFDVWCRGIKFTYTTTQSVTLPDVSDLYYIYFDSNGDLDYQASFFSLETQAPTAYVYWNADEGKTIYFGDERHGIVLDWQTHEYLHRTRGASLASGFGIQNYTTIGTGSIDVDAQVDITNGTFYDEDLQVDITHSETPIAESWQQHLVGPAKIPVVYRDSTLWNIDVATNFPVKAGTARPVYNLNTAGNWSTVDIAVNRYLSVFVAATNKLGDPVISVLGQTEHVNIGDAANYLWSDLSLSDFPSLEFRPLYHLIYQCGDYGNSIQARLRQVIDIRYSGIGANVPTGGTGDGATGATGATGVIGATGATGATGAGVTGATGPSGGAGATGPQGPSGPAGPTGVSGVQGATGIQGAAGVAGATGVDGPTGATGVQGATGVEGVTGPSGATGLSGQEGATGVTGEIGLTGATGPVGATGIEGIPGINPTGRILYFSQPDSDVLGYETLTPNIPDSSAQDDMLANFSSIDGEHLIQEFITPSSNPGIDELPAGEYTIRFWSYVSSDLSDTRLVFRFYKRTLSDIETQIFYIESSEINTLTSSFYTSSIILTDSYTDITSDDRIVIKVYGTTTSSSSIAAHFLHSGSTPSSCVTAISLGYIGPTGAIGVTGATGATGPAGPIGSTGVSGQDGATGIAGATGLAGTTGATGAQGPTGSQGPTGVIGATGATGVIGVSGPTGATGVGLTGATGPIGATGLQGPSGPAGVSSYKTITGTTYTLVEEDRSQILLFTNAAAITLTVPTGLSALFDTMIVQTSTGQITVTPAIGVTVNAALSATKTAYQYAIATLVPIGTNTFILAGAVVM